MSRVSLAWSSVQWPCVIARICRLQRRIYKARLVGSIKRVHWLQNKLIHSLDAKLLAVHLVTIENKSFFTSAKNQHIRFSTSVNTSVSSSFDFFTPHRGKTKPKPKGSDLTLLSSNDKLSLAKNLSIDGKAFNYSNISYKNCQLSFPKSDKRPEQSSDYDTKSHAKRRAFYISVICDRAKQALTVLALEPEWEAIFEPVRVNSGV